MISLQCPVCGLQAHVRAKAANITCPHTGTKHERPRGKNAAVMVNVIDPALWPFCEQRARNAAADSAYPRLKGLKY